MTTGNADLCARTHLRLRAALEARFFGAGWVTDESIDCSVGERAVAAFRRPIGDGLMVSALFDRHTDQLPFEMMVTIGIAYESLDRLWPLLTDEPTEDAIFHGLTGLHDGVVVGDERDAETAADALTDILMDEVDSYVRQYGGIAALLAANRGPDVDLDTEMYVVPALLASAGRFEDSLAALAAYQPSRARAALDRLLDPVRDYCRFSQQLTRWLDSATTGDP